MSWKDWFVMNRLERTGTVVLGGIVVILLIIRLVLPIIYLRPARTDPALLAKMGQLRATTDSIAARQDMPYFAKVYDTLSLFAFDPNEADSTTWRALGLKPYQISTIQNYTSKGGKFYDKNDVKKMYCISDEQFSYLKPYISIAQPKQARSRQKPAAGSKKQKARQKGFQPDTLFYFNPNTLPIGKLCLLFPEKLANTILKYREKGGRFYEKGDIKKIYGLSQNLAEKLIPYIRIPKATHDERQDAPKPQKQAREISVELNTATPEKLKQLSGIGPYYAKQIIKYRELLGGFVNKTQLLEVYNFKEETYQRIHTQVRADAGKVKKINLNTASFKQILRHPYFNYYQTKQLFGLRDAGKKISGKGQLLEHHIVIEAEMENVLPYLEW